jgi:hypothetical protein
MRWPMKTARAMDIQTTPMSSLPPTTLTHTSDLSKSKTLSKEVHFGSRTHSRNSQESSYGLIWLFKERFNIDGPKSPYTTRLRLNLDCTTRLRMDSHGIWIGTLQHKRRNYKNSDQHVFILLEGLLASRLAPSWSKDQAQLHSRPHHHPAFFSSGSRLASLESTSSSAFSPEFVPPPEVAPPRHELGWSPRTLALADGDRHEAIEPDVHRIGCPVPARTSAYTDQCFLAIIKPTISAVEANSFKNKRLTMSPITSICRGVNTTTSRSPTGEGVRGWGVSASRAGTCSSVGALHLLPLTARHSAHCPLLPSKKTLDQQPKASLPPAARIPWQSVHIGLLASPRWAIPRASRLISS